jgi:ADP-ribose pyrophosphatase YjhB (NUDIX family)
MIENIEINHHIQKHILGVLLRQKVARFRDMRAPKTDTNLYSYHLTQLLKGNLVKKVDGGYTLDTKGLIYVDRLNAEKLFIRQQPKIITMFVIQNSDGDVLLQRRSKQPYIEKWTLPNGKLHNDDSTLMAAATREAFEKLNVHSQTITHAGDCYMRVHYGDTAMTVTLAHIFTFNRDDIEMTDRLQWIQPHKLHTIDLAPSVEEIIARAFFRDTFFFEEYSHEW